VAQFNDVSVSQYNSVQYLLELLFLNFSDYLFKLLLIGDSGVGKSCLLLRFAVRIALLLIITHLFLLYCKKMDCPV
jgi:RecA-family ATPase